MGNAAVVAILLVVFLIGIKPRENKDTSLSLEQSNVIKGMAALILVCVHIGNVMTEPGVYSSVLSPFGYLMVSIFFFYSGYGTFLGMKKLGGGYRYLVKQIKKVVCLLVFTELVYYIVYLMFGKVEFSLVSALECLSGFHMLAGQMWYMHALIVIYLGMVVTELVLKETRHRDVIAASVGIFAYFAYIALRGRPFHEIQSCMAFLLGGLVMRYDNVRHFIVPADGKKVRRGVVYSSVFVFSLMVIYGVRHFAKDYYLIRMIFGWTSSIAFICILYLVLDSVQLGNKLLRFIGRYFTWIYLSHTLIISILYWIEPKWYEGQYNFIISVVVFAITLGVSIPIGELMSYKKAKHEEKQINRA